MMRYTIFLFLFFQSAVVLCAPSISGVSGTASDGNTITISGSGFGTNTATQEWTGPNIESGSVGQLFSKTRWSDMNSWAPVNYASDQAHSGSKSIKVTVDPSNNWNGLFVYNFATPISPGSSGYLTWWVRVGASTAAGQWKMLRLSQNNTIVDGPQELVLFNWYDASGSQKVIDPGTANDQTEWNSVGFPRSNGTWQRVEFAITASGANQTNGSNTLGLYNGSTYTSATWSGTRNFMLSGQQYNYALFQNYMGNGISGNIPIWFDDILIQPGLARVELCDSAAWSGRAHCEIQPNASWSASSISVAFNKGSFVSGNTAYLYVVDSANAVNSSGYPVTIGSGGGGTTYTVTPSAGANGTISPNTPQTVNAGSTTAFTVTANNGYTASVGGTCGGSLVGTTYTTNAITANCTVSATFADTTPPAILISTSDPSTIISDSLTVLGAASDIVGIAGCKWRIGSAPNSSAGTACTGTTAFSCSTSTYVFGANALYVGCYDAAGNYGSDSIAVNYIKFLPKPSNIRVLTQ